MTDRKKVLVAGLGRSGMASAAFAAADAEVTAWDSKAEEKFKKEDLDQLRAAGVKFLFGDAPSAAGYDELLLSPGVPLSIPLVQEAKALGKEITGEIERAYRGCKGTFIAITGTNGKTTTTTLVGEVFKRAGKDTRVVGNIGLPATAEAASAKEDTVMVTEVSSFQLETTTFFRPHISAILNITPDHLNRHGTFEEYARCKALVFANQTEEDYFVYNLDDPETVKIVPQCKKAKLVPFSRKQELSGTAAWVKDGVITVGGTAICRAEELQIPGAHNLENALAAAAICYYAGIPADVIAAEFRTFMGVEHRIEFVRELDGVRYVNDSKGTNPDSTIKAIEATKAPILLVAGGYEKNSDFTELIETFGGKVEYLLMIGFTAPRFAERAKELGFPEDHIIFNKNMEEVVANGRKLAKPGATVLLSPASASWDMYTGYEERGRHFKSIVNALK